MKRRRVSSLLFVTLSRHPFSSPFSRRFLSSPLSMNSPSTPIPRRAPTTPLRILAEQAFSRAAGAPLVGGNSVRVLKDADENFPAWLAAIASAKRTVLFEHYMVADDHVGRDFIAALAERARAGVRVCVIYDWFGSFGLGGPKL